MKTQLLSESSSPSASRSRSVIEWVTFGLASTLLAAIAGLVAYTWSLEGSRPAELKVHPVEPIRAVDGQFYVPFELSNTGGETAESVHVEAELKLDEETQETSQIEVDFLSSGEKEEGAFVFSHDPRRGQLSVRVTSYRKP